MTFLRPIFLLASCFLSAAALLGVEVEVNLAIKAGQRTSAPLHGTVQAIPAGRVGPGEQAESIHRDVIIPGQLSLDLQPGIPWRLHLNASSYWAPPEVIVPLAQGKQTVRLVLLSTSKIVGRLKLPNGEPMPAEFKVRFQSAAVPGQDEIPQTSFTCPVAQGRFLCQVPVGILDLRLRAKSFVSHYRWGISLRPDKAVDVGTLALRRGASIVGRVEVGEGQLDLSTCRVKLSPQKAGAAPSAADKERFLGLQHTNRINAHGFFHFEGIPPGSYAVTAEQPGFAPVRLFPVTVLKHVETEIQAPLVLEPPLTLEVQLQPALDWLEKPWKVVLLKRSEIPGNVELIADRGASSEGTFSQEGLAPGAYVVMVRDAAGGEMGLREVELTRDAPLLLMSLDLVWVEGEILIGEEPLSAELIFGGHFSVEKVTMVADEEGEFFGYLPREGDWLVAVQAEEPPVVRNIPEVEVRKRGSSTARVKIELPDTEVRGEVVDETGEQVAGALVRLYEEKVSGGHAIRADEEGRFVFRGLAEGRSLISAESHQGTSEEVVVNLVADRLQPPLRLVLRQKQLIAGQVLSATGGVPRAPVWVATYRGGPHTPNIDLATTTTDITGSFELAIPASATHLQLTAFPPGYALATLPISEISKERFIVQVQPHGGTLTFELAEPIDWVEPWSPRPTLFIDGIALPWYFLKRWADINAVNNPDELHFTVPRLRAGNYQACLLPASPQALQAPLDPNNSSCRPGAVVPFSETTVKMAAPRKP